MTKDLGGWLTPASSPSPQSYSLGDLRRFEDERARNESVMGNIDQEASKMGSPRMPWTETPNVNGVPLQYEGFSSPDALKNQESLYHIMNMKKLYGE